jgi:catecholate siderophore receptor
VPTQRAGASINTVAGYLYDTIELNRQQVVGGLRVEHYAANLDSKTIAGAPVSGGAVDGFRRPKRPSAARSAWCTSRSIRQPVCDVRRIASASGLLFVQRGHFADRLRHGRSGISGLRRGADPVRFHNYEVGVKWNFFNDASPRQRLCSVRRSGMRPSPVLMSGRRVCDPEGLRSADRQGMNSV